MKRRNRAYRLLRLTAVYLLLLPFLLLGWLYSRLPDCVYLEPGQALLLPRFGWVEPMGLHGSQNAASTQVVGSYQTTLSLGGWLPIKNIRTVVTERTQVTVCGTPFGVKMFSEGALIVGFSDIDSPGGSTVNPAKAAGLRLGDRVIRIGQIRTENNDAVKEALEAARGSAAEVIYVRSGEQRSTTLTPVWDAAAAQWRAGMWVRDSSAGVGTLTFVDPEKGVFAGLGHPISDGDTGESIALRSGEIVPCEITGCSMGTVGSPGELKGKFLSAHAIGSIRINGENGVYGTTRTGFSGQTMPVAFAQEVETGDAQILATVSGETPRTYHVPVSYTHLVSIPSITKQVGRPTRVSTAMSRTVPLSAPSAHWPKGITAFTPPRSNRSWRWVSKARAVLCKISRLAMAARSSAGLSRSAER